MGTARAVGGAPRVALARDRHRLGEARFQIEVRDLLQVPTGEHHRPGAELEHGPSELPGCEGRRVTRLSALRPGARLAELSARAGARDERSRLRQVRGRDGRPWQDLLDERAAGLGVEQDGPALGDHHGVDDHGRPRLELLQRLSHGQDGLGAREHPHLDGIDADVRQDGLHLPHDDLARDLVDGAHPDRVLDGDRRDRGHPVDAATGEGLQVSLDPRASAGVRAGDREDSRGSLGRGSHCHRPDAQLFNSAIICSG